MQTTSFARRAKYRLIPRMIEKISLALQFIIKSCNVKDSVILCFKVFEELNTKTHLKQFL